MKKTYPLPDRPPQSNSVLSLLVFVVVLAMASALPLAAQIDPLSELVENSPFLPEGFGRTVAPPQANPLDRFELRSIISIDGVLSFSIFSQEQNRGFWVDFQKTDSNSGITVTEYDLSRNMVTITRGNHTRSLQLRESTVASAPTQLPAAARPSNGSPSPPPVPTVPMDQMSDTEVRDRMQRIAEEIRRRRAERRTVVEQGASN